MKKNKQITKTKTVLVPADVLAELQFAVFQDRSTGDLNRSMVMLPGQHPFFITENLESTAATLGQMYGLDSEQSLKAARYLAALPNVRAKEERRIRAEARRANNENAYAGWSSRRDNFGSFF